MDFLRVCNDIDLACKVQNVSEWLVLGHGLGLTAVFCFAFVIAAVIWFVFID